MILKTFFIASFAMLYSFTAVANNNPALKLIKNTEYTLDTSVMGFFQKPTAQSLDADDASIVGRFTLKSDVWLNDYFSTGFDLYAAYSSQKGEYAGVFRNPGHQSTQARIVDFNTAWLRYESEYFALILGKQYIEMGLSDLYSPVDRFGLHNFSNPSQPYKIGVWQVSIDYFINDDTLSFKLLPVYERSLFPSQHSRWLGNTEDPQFFNLTSQYQISDYYYPVRIENMGYLLQYKGYRAGYDFFAALHHGPSIYPTLRNGLLANELTKQDPLATSISVGILKVINQWTVSAEVIYQLNDNNSDQDFIRYSVGVSYNESNWSHKLGLNQIKTSLQWSGDEVVDSKLSDAINTSSNDARPFQKTLFFKIEVEQSEKWSYLISIAHSINTDLGLFTGIEYKRNNNLSFRLESGFFSGHSDSFFGRWKDNNYLRLRTLYTF